MVRHWSEEEVTYLEDKWGVVSIKGIAKHLDKSINAVKLKAQRLGLGDARFNGDGITLNQLANALNLQYSHVKEWFRSKGLPARKKVFCAESRVLFISYNDFWTWAEANKNLINLSRLEPNMIGPEPEWAKEKRRADKLSYRRILERPWEKDDDSRLIGLVNAQRYTYPEIAKVMRRTEGAIKRRLYDLGVKARPVRLNNHIKWTETETQLLLDLFHKGYGYNTIAEKVGKSEHACRGKLERMGFRFRKAKEG